MKKNETVNETMETSAEFTLENIEKGLFDTKKIGNKTDWQMFASLRLIIESEQTMTEEALSIIKDQKYKWYYYKKLSDNNTGNIIIGLHKKDIPSWLYIVVDTKTGSKKEYKSLREAKDSFTTTIE